MQTIRLGWKENEHARKNVPPDRVWKVPRGIHYNGDFQLLRKSPDVRRPALYVADLRSRVVQP